LIPDEVVDHVMMPLIDAKVLLYLKCADSKWRTKIEEYGKKICANVQICSQVWVIW